MRARTVRGLSPGATIDDFDLLIALGQGAFARVFDAIRAADRAVDMFLTEHRSDGFPVGKISSEIVEPIRRGGRQTL
ncbi:hypothetical protein [Nocardia suismassiliense]|uniref:hypothetical protein n=1 Tax=Nocardia suismassiliense TaxID=2077092 RepID=UPI000D1E8918|nr:hypothetical protein [Nocardia suismassiliense]